DLKIETAPRTLDWRESEHASELIVPLLKARSQETGDRRQETGADSAQNPQRQGAAALQNAGAQGEAFGVRQSPGALASPSALLALPPVAAVLEELQHLHNPPATESLSPELAAQL